MFTSEDGKVTTTRNWNGKKGKKEKQQRWTQSVSEKPKLIKSEK